MRLAEVVSLIDTDPENSKGGRARDVIVEQVLKADFKLRLAGLKRIIFAGFAAGQSIEPLRGAKEYA